MMLTSRVHNFNPGPAVLPLEVLEQAKLEMTEYGEAGMSLMEMSHRSKPVERLLEETEELLVELLGLPAGYRVLFMGGGASTQFALIPMNFLPAGAVGHYVLTGSFADKAYQEAKAFGGGTVNAIASGKADKWRKLPDLDGLHAHTNLADAAYVHLTTNNTIEGTQLGALPSTGNTPIIADMTSDLLTRQLDWAKLGMSHSLNLP
jgi:phosphoserine aminotransferase